MKNRAAMNDLRHRKPRPLFTQEQCTRCPSVKKTTAVLERAMTEKSDCWKTGEWYGSTKTRWQQPAGSSGRQSSVDTWEHVKPKGKWTKVSADNRVLDALVKEKKITGQRAAEKVQKEKPTCAICLKKELQMKREKKGTGISLVTS